MEQGIYREGQSADPLNCLLSLEGETLNIFFESGENRFLVWNVRNLVSCHFSGSKLHLTYGKFPNQSLECGGAIARRIYDVWSGKSPIRKAEGFLSRKTNVAVLLICVFFLGIAALIYFYALPWAGEKAASLIPRDVEIELGQGLAERLNEGESEGQRADSLLNAFGRKIDLGTEYPLRLHVLRSDEINAFAVPGGNIFVYSGIIAKMDSYEQLVALLGHEVSHVEKRHSLKSICRSAASAFFIAALFGDVGGISAGIMSQADEFRQLQYSRELETEADLEGLRLMRKNHINQRGMLNLLELLRREGQETPGLMKYVSSHPETTERINNVEANLSTAEVEFQDKLSALFLELKQELKAMPGQGS